MESVYFDLHIPLEPAELDAEANRILAKIESTLSEKMTEEAHQRALERTREFIGQHRAGHFRVECRILDGNRVPGFGVVELEVLFKGRLSSFLVDKQENH